MNIGYSKDNYPEKRNIIDQVKNINYIKINKKLNIYTYINYICKKILKSKSINNMFKFKSIIKFEHIDMFHFFNDINIGKEKYITTFETCVPRVDIFMNNFNQTKNINEKKIKLIMKPLTRENCKLLIAISEATKNIQLSLIDNCDIRDKNIIKDKIMVVHPPQEMIIKNYCEKKKYLYSDLTFIFVGKDFYRKGGYEATIIFNKLSKKFKNIKLILIGDINNTWDYTKEVLNSEILEINRIIKENNNIKLFANISNYDVIELMKKSHVGLLNTWADTYGYSVLEMQASGCPVITTNVRALPEINNNECGWIIDLPLTDSKEANYFTKESREKIRNILLEKLELIMTEIILNKDVIEEKANNSLNRIYEEHNPYNYEKLMKEIYYKFRSDKL